MNCRRSIAVLAFLAAIAPASAVTLDLAPPPWARWNPPSENNRFATYAVWNFDADPGNDFSLAPDNDAMIESNPLACLLCGNSATFPDSAQWTNGAWDFSMEGVIDVSLTNVIDDRPVKFIRAQVTWIGEEGDAPRFYATSAFDPSVPAPGLIPRFGGMIVDTDPFGTHTWDPASQRWHSLYLSEIRPNPNNENFEIYIAGRTSIDGLIIDTFSAIPEPSRALFGLFGLLGAMAANRRRR